MYEIVAGSLTSEIEYEISTVTAARLSLAQYELCDGRTTIEPGTKLQYVNQYIRHRTYLTSFLM